MDEESNVYAKRRGQGTSPALPARKVARVCLGILLGVTARGLPEGLDLFRSFPCQIVVGPVRLEACDLR